MTHRLADLYNRLVLGSPRLVILVLLCLCAWFAWHAGDFDLDASADSLLLENDHDLRMYRVMARRYGSQEFLFVAFVPTGDLFSDESLQAIRSMRDEFRALDLVESVVSLVDIPLVKMAGGKLSEVANNYTSLENPATDRAKAREELLNSPLFNELIISKDGTTTAMMLNLREDSEYREAGLLRNELTMKKYEAGLSPDEHRQLEQVSARYDAAKKGVDAGTHRVIGEIRDIMARHAGAGDLYLGGVPMIADDMISYIKNDLAWFGTGIFIFLVGMLTIIFRQRRWVILPLLSCLYAGLFMIGLLGLVGWRVTVISSNFISLMLILTMSMNVHLVVRYRQLQRDHPDSDQRQLVFDTARKMVWPCLYTALTTMIGFGSLVVSGIKPVIDFGWMMTLGLAVTFLTSFLLFPAILILLRKPPPPGHEREEVPFTAALASLTERRGGLVLLLSVLLAIASVAGVTRLKVENSFVNYFSDSTEIYRGLKLIDDKLGGTTSLDIVLDLGEANHEAGAVTDGEDEEFDELFGEIEVDKADYWFTPEKIDLIKGVHDYLESLPAVGKVRSLASTIRVAEDLARGQEFNTFELAIIYKRLPDVLRAEMITPYVSIEDDEARINLRVKDSLRDLRRKELLEEIRSGIEKRFEVPPERLQMAGLLVLYNNMLQSLFKSQIETLGVVMLGIAVMLLVLFRSVSLAIIGIIPNILAAGIILGLMGLAGIPLDMMTITIAAITIGIAVDNSIHYIYRFREEYPRHRDYHTTMRYCHANIGRAVYYTAITIIVGFSILVTSNFIPTIYFGLLTALAMFIALIAALTLLPRLILMWKPF